MHECGLVTSTRDDGARHGSHAFDLEAAPKEAVVSPHTMNRLCVLYGRKTHEQKDAKECSYLLDRLETLATVHPPSTGEPLEWHGKQMAGSRSSGHLHRPLARYTVLVYPCCRMVLQCQGVGCHWSKKQSWQITGRGRHVPKRARTDSTTTRPAHTLDRNMTVT